MNKRILKLAVRVGAHEVAPHDFLLRQEQLEKFAELIVRECAEVCDELQNVPATEPRHCAEDIRIRFGVEK